MEPAALREPERSAARLRPFSLGAQRVRLAEASDSDAIAALNHRTFVQELGQYEDDGSGARVDRFHAKNRYLLCERGWAQVATLGEVSDADLEDLLAALR
ncbi:MAG: hypothetical protein PVJ89_06660 [Planctomycetota bacterium]|jgi:hypothetical protein